MPPSVPSLTHGSWPLVPSLASNTALDPNGTMDLMVAPVLPSRMSLTMLVPAAVPSLVHSSAPCTPSSSTKNSVSPAAVSSVGFLLLEVPGMSSATTCVPAVVPSVTQSSGPIAGVIATKNTLSPTAVIPCGLPAPPPGTMSRSITPE